MPGFGFVEFGIWTCIISVCIPFKAAATLTTTTEPVPPGPGPFDKCSNSTTHRMKPL
ncbi:hypothetical protein DPMN_120652 [Dreissena polymorpha]|uniref:Uncharacterized protein n=1 Tax=Dreissena polymorpha TaxID=45954 RepID=A0A9D4GNY4_DREPO|nr:hypothetical protein DPMN_120652 [Dreissena polymorpha]